MFYKNTQVKVNQLMDSVLTQRHNKMERAFARDGIEGVITGIRATESDDPLDFGVAYQIADGNGSVLAGKLSEHLPSVGLYDASASSLGFQNSDTGFRVDAREVGNHQFTAALNANIRDDLLKGYFSSIALTFVVTSILALLGAMFLSYRYNQRYHRLAQFMEGVGNGNLDRRLSVSGRNDAVDRLSRDINNALALLQKQITGMSQVSCNIAHDLKTPLNRLSIKIEEALDASPADQPVHDILTAANENATEINDTFEKLLYIAQLDAGARKSRFVFTDLQQLLKKVYEVFHVVAADNKQTLRLESKDSLRLLGDDDLLLQLVVNLVENCMNHNGPDTEIVIAAGMEKDQPWVRVSDNGIGVPHAEQELLFDPLYRMEKSRTTRGAGLGLSLVRAIAELHGATIELCDNNPGLCIKICFPA